ncbi:unnamed protein product [marine sediment metagenome]|uniref:Uncharacterized protein n=1 Tax=marine sediment metagenome TaxID=412755 RepID=X1GBF1_9ZZZZ
MKMKMIIAVIAALVTAISGFGVLLYATGGQYLGAVALVVLPAAILAGLTIYIVLRKT